MMKLFNFLLVCLVLSGCGSGASTSSGKGDASASYNFRYPLQASAGHDEAASAEQGYYQIPQSLERSAGANTVARAVLSLGGTDCYYNDVPNSSAMALQQCTGGAETAGYVSLSSGSTLRLHVENGNVTVNTEVVGVAR